MTTFQVLIDAFLRALTHVLPLSPEVSDTATQTLLGWTLPVHELELLTLICASLVFLFFFRFDWLGMISAFLTSIFKPMSLKPATRTLDQHTLLFLLIVFLPTRLLLWGGASIQGEWEILREPLFFAGVSILAGIGFRLSHRWNKRIHGLNHLKLSHGVGIGLISALSFHPAMTLIGSLWVGFAFFNYHYESIFKYSMLILGLNLFTKTISQLNSVHLKDALNSIGHLNSIAVVVISLGVFWISLEHFQKTLSSKTYRTFQWTQFASGIYFIILYFVSRT